MSVRNEMLSTCTFVLILKIFLKSDFLVLRFNHHKTFSASLSKSQTFNYILSQDLKDLQKNHIKKLRILVNHFFIKLELFRNWSKKRKNFHTVSFLSASNLTESQNKK